MRSYSQGYDPARTRELKLQRAMFFLLLAALGTAAVWTTLLRTTFPRHIDGTVTHVERRQEKHPGIDDVWLITVRGDAFVVTEPVAQIVRRGEPVLKERWSFTIRTREGDFEIPPSTDLLNLPAAVAAVWLVGSMLLVQRRRTPWRP